MIIENKVYDTSTVDVSARDVHKRLPRVSESHHKMRVFFEIVFIFLSIFLRREKERGRRESGRVTNFTAQGLRIRHECLLGNLSWLQRQRKRRSLTDIHARARAHTHTHTHTQNFIAKG